MSHRNALLGDAGQAFVDDASCEKPRAEALAKALGDAAASEALAVAAGDDLIYGSALDARVARLRRVVENLGEGAVPNIYEIGVMFRITPTQARNVLGTYQARFTGRFRERMDDKLKQHKPSSITHETHGDVFRWQFDDPGVLDYAIDKLRRQGLSRLVWKDEDELTLMVDRDARDRHKKDAKSVLSS